MILISSFLHLISGDVFILVESLLPRESLLPGEPLFFLPRSKGLVLITIILHNTIHILPGHQLSLLLDTIIPYPIKPWKHISGIDPLQKKVPKTWDGLSTQHPVSPIHPRETLHIHTPQ